MSYSFDLEKLYESSASTFFKEKWGMIPGTFEKIPIMTFDDIFNVPLYKRLFSVGDKSSLIRIIERGNKKILIKKEIESIKKYPLAIGKSLLVFVLFSNSDDSIEYSLWCYQNKAVPFVGYKTNTAASSKTAEYFGCTILVGDMAMIDFLYEEKQIPSTVDTIYIIDSSFHTHELLLYIHQKYTLKLFFALPEAGVIGRLDGKFNSLYVNNVSNGILCEDVNNKCVVTNVNLPTPLVRYDTSISCRRQNNKIYLT